MHTGICPLAKSAPVAQRTEHEVPDLVAAGSIPARRATPGPIEKVKAEVAAIIEKKGFDKTAYQRDYMRKRRRKP